jgi:hypothetical protein
MAEAAHLNGDESILHYVPRDLVLDCNISLGAMKPEKIQLPDELDRIFN